MTTGPVNGNDIRIYIGGVQVACLQDCEFQSTKESIPVRCKDYTGSLNGTGTWQITGTGVFRFDAGYGAIDLLTAHKNNTEVEVKFGNEVVGDKHIAGTCKIPQFTWAGPLDNAATFNITLEGQGDYDIVTNV